MKERTALGEAILKHWREHFPQMVLELEKDNRLDQATLVRFRRGLLGANRKEKGQVLLTLFRLTGFEAAPANFDRMLAQTQKTFPPPKFDDAAEKRR